VYRIQLTILLALLFAVPAWAQDDADTSEEAPVEEEAVAPEDEVTDEEIEELLGLDEDYADIEDDDFDSSVEVRFEQSVPFPVDI
jgi:hypothetical protein